MEDKEERERATPRLLRPLASLWREDREFRKQVPLKVQIFLVLIFIASHNILTRIYRSIRGDISLLEEIPVAVALFALLAVAAILFLRRWRHRHPV